ncbi:MAG: GumC family protein [Akkermansiaceae bacterium]
MSQPNDSSPPVPRPPSFPKTQEKNTSPEKGRFGFPSVLGRWWWLGTLAVVLVTIVVSMIPGWLNMRGPLYESTALVEVKPVIHVNPLKGSSVGMPMSRNFLNTQSEIITAKNTLDIALEKKNLLIRFGGDQEDAISRMRKSIRTTQRRGTDLIEISYRDEDKELALDACTAVYEAYRDRRNAMELQIRKDQLKAIKVELENKKNRVAEQRKRLMDIAEKVGVTWVEKESGGEVIGGELELRQLLEKQLYEAERERDQLKFQIQKLLAADEGDLLPLAADLPDAAIKETYKKYEEAKQEIEKLKNSGLAEAHPDIKMHRERVEEFEKALKKRVENVRKSLRHREAILDGRVKKLKQQRDSRHGQSARRARDFQGFNITRKDYETAQGIADQLQIKHDIEKTKLAIPPTNIIVHQTPELSSSPVTRGKDFVTIIGTVASLPFTIIGGIVLMYLVEAIFPRKA